MQYFNWYLIKYLYRLLVYKYCYCRLARAAISVKIRIILNYEACSLLSESVSFTTYLFSIREGGLFNYENS